MAWRREETAAHYVRTSAHPLCQSANYRPPYVVLERWERTGLSSGLPGETSSLSLSFPLPLTMVRVVLTEEGLAPTVM